MEGSKKLASSLSSYSQDLLSQEKKKMENVSFTDDFDDIIESIKDMKLEESHLQVNMNKQDTHKNKIEAFYPYGQYFNSTYYPSSSYQPQSFYSCLNMQQNPYVMNNIMFYPKAINPSSNNFHYITNNSILVNNSPVYSINNTTNQLLHQTHKANAKAQEKLVKSDQNTTNNNSLECFINDKSLFMKKINSKKGSLKLQTLLQNEKNPELINKLFLFLCPILSRLTNHMFGNYFLQTFIMKLDFEKKNFLWQLYKDNIEKYIINDFGVHIIIKLVQYTPILPLFIKELLMNDIEKYIYFPLGSYLYQVFYDNLISSKSSYKAEFEFLIFSLSFNLCQNINSVVLIKKVIINMKNDSRKTRSLILHNFIPHLGSFLKNKFGCQTIESILFHWELDLLEKALCDEILTDLIYYSINKYSFQLIKFIIVNRVDARVSLIIIFKYI